MKEGDFSPNSSFEKIDEKSHEDSEDLEENFYTNLVKTLLGLTKISESLKIEINKNSFTSFSIENIQDLKTDKKTTPLNKASKFKSPLSYTSFPSSQGVGSLRRVTVRNKPGTISKKTNKTQINNLGIYFGHENWNLVLNMIIGIRTSIKSLYSISDNVEVKDYEFDMKGHFELIQKRVAGFDMRKASKFYDYAPSIFERIRKKFGISNEMYLRSIGPESLLGSIIMGNLASLTELMSSGKSGSFFYFTGDCMVCFSIF